MAFERKVFICSLFAPVEKEPEKHDKELMKNILKAQAACAYALAEGVIPCAPHLYFTQFMDDKDPELREFGQALGLGWLAECDELWVIGRRIRHRRCFVYIMHEERKLGIPHRSYIDTCIEGYRHFGFDEGYLHEALHYSWEGSGWKNLKLDER